MLEGNFYYPTKKIMNNHIDDPPLPTKMMFLIVSKIQVRQI